MPSTLENCGPQQLPVSDLPDKETATRVNISSFLPTPPSAL